MVVWYVRPRMFALAVAAEMFPGGMVLLRCDNKGARQALSRGSRKTDLGNMLCATFWAIAASFSTPVWIESVAGTLNPSDTPSRDCVHCEKRIICDAKRREAPSVFKRVLSSYTSIHFSQFSIPLRELGFVPAWPCPEKGPNVV